MFDLDFAEYYILHQNKKTWFCFTESRKQEYCDIKQGILNLYSYQNSKQINIFLNLKQ